jgi:glutamate 5-kinase
MEDTPQDGPADSPSGDRPGVADAKRIVVKVGTRVLTRDDGQIALARLFSIVEAVAGLRTRGQEVLMVSSGAVGLGAGALGMSEIPLELTDRQACAAVGQTRLVGLYQEGLAHLGLVCGQVLLTQADFDDRDRYLSLRATLLKMLARGILPIINENDAVSTEELAMWEGGNRPVFGDNDRLSALVASKLDADLLVILTDVDGLFDRDPRLHPQATLIDRVSDLSELEPDSCGTGSTAGRGGMRTKVEAAMIAARSGCHAVIASGHRNGALEAVLAGRDSGTWFPAHPGLRARDRWIAWAAAPRGTLHLDAGAVSALRLRGASLLAAGVTAVDGSFHRGDVVELRDPDGQLIGRGLMRYDAAAARAWSKGAEPSDPRDHRALVRRDRIVLE